jgi:hypothetical protein
MSTPPTNPQPSPSLIEKYTPPPLTFGLELEFDFCVRKTLHMHWTGEHLDPLKSPYVQVRTAAQKRVDAGLPARKDSDGTDSTDSQSFSLIGSLLKYLQLYLNHDLPDSVPLEENKFGRVAIGEPKTLTADSWHVTYDDSLRPSRMFLPVPVKDVQSAALKQALYRVNGAELVSEVLGLKNDDSWVPMLQQLASDLDPANGERWGYFEPGGSEALHVHFGIWNDGEALNGELGLKAVKNLLALYGLFENQIEEFIPVSQRDEELWCPRLRLGMERLKREKVPGTQAQYYATEPKKRYTPEEFTEGIYKCGNLRELKSFVTGEPMTGKWADGSERVMRDLGNYATVNISLARSNKPTTIEFRHQKGTLDPEVIYYWVKFCGSLVQTAYFYALQDFEVRNAVPPTENHEDSFLQELLRRDPDSALQYRSILDTVGFSDEGKIFFAEQKEKNFDGLHGVLRFLDEKVVEERSRRVARGERTGVEMDAEIMVSSSHQDVKSFL